MPSPTLPPSQPKPTSDAPRTALAALIAAAALVAGGLAIWSTIPARPLPVLGEVPPFTLLERSGRTVTATDLAGHVWVADFVFTHCPSFCPTLTTHMAGLQRTLAPAAQPVRLVSFSVDPAHDTPEVLTDYARQAGAGDNWLFLTGQREALAALMRDGFKVAWADDGPPSSPITHSDRFVLVDRTLRIRGYYHGTEPDDVARLARDAITLSDGKGS